MSEDCVRRAEGAALYVEKENAKQVQGFGSVLWWLILLCSIQSIVTPRICHTSLCLRALIYVLKNSAYLDVQRFLQHALSLAPARTLSCFVTSWIDPRRNDRLRREKSRALMWMHLGCFPQLGLRLVKAAVVDAVGCSWERLLSRHCCVSNRQHLQRWSGQALRAQVPVSPMHVGHPWDESGRCCSILLRVTMVVTAFSRLSQKSTTFSRQFLLSLRIFYSSNCVSSRNKHTGKQRDFFLNYCELHLDNKFLFYLIIYHLSQFELFKIWGFCLSENTKNCLSEKKTFWGEVVFSVFCRCIHRVFSHFLLITKTFNGRNVNDFYFS